MEGHLHFNAPRPATDESTFRPTTKLPEHLAQYEKIGKSCRTKMTPVMQTVLELMDKTVLRSAALPQNSK